MLGYASPHQSSEGKDTALLKAPEQQVKSDDKSTAPGASSAKKERYFMYNIDCIDEGDGNDEAEGNNEESECEEQRISEVSETNICKVSRK
mmetsp:Transcript_32912/g.40703  ORF Transcript_32912/g.40703 Transcript_32912/m.40703 type:complete len:91 (+) Transcript_32912:91-363(+)